jgi:hypothetical protein
MFVPDAELDRTSLRQGDILAGIPFPLFDLSKTVVLGRVRGDRTQTGIPAAETIATENRGDREWFSTVVSARLSFCAVLSNCCDIEPRDGRILIPMVALARLRPIPPNIQRDAPKLESLRANKNPANPEDPGYIDYFYLPAHERLERAEWVIHYNQVVAMGTAPVPELMERKILQMVDRERVKFKIKLAYSLARIGDHEINAGLQNPWQ